MSKKQDVFSVNKGEWSELYAFLKLLCDGKLYNADETLKRIESNFYPIISIIRKEAETTKYDINGAVKILNSTGELLLRVPVQEFKEAADIILSKIKTQKSSIEIEEIRPFLKKINVKKIKTKSTSKRDITVIVHDYHTCLNPELGFSIKSKLGDAPTLLNAGKTTNFLYSITGKSLNDSTVKEINSLNTKSKIQDRYKRIHNNCSVKFLYAQSSIFQSNMTLIDSKLPDIMSELLKIFYLGDGGNISYLTQKVTEKNPCKFNMEHAHEYYKYKIKSLLKEVALGMTPAKVWNGKHDATGGYLIVKEDGEIVCYHLYNINEFENYLFNNTKLETASSLRHKFGKIEKTAGKYIFRLNLQIRFI